MGAQEQLCETDSSTAPNLMGGPTRSSKTRGLPAFVGLAVLLIGGAAGAMIGVGQSADWLGLWGFRLTFWGLVVSIAGFVFTIWQLARTQSAAQAGAEALQRLRRDFRSLDVIIEIGSARDAVRITQASLGEPDWPMALAGYDKIRRSVDKSLAAETGLLVEEVEILKEYQAHFIGACDAIESLIRKDSMAVETGLFKSKLREFESYLTQLEYKIRDRFGAK